MGTSACVFSRLNRSSSKTKDGTPSSSRAKPEFMRSRYDSKDAHEVPTRDRGLGFGRRSNWAALRHLEWSGSG